jgi:HEAT repeat protein
MMVRSILLILASAMALAAQSDPEAFGFGFQTSPGSHEDPNCQAGRRALDAAQLEKAIADLKACAAHKPGSADAALYWLAYAQDHAGQREASLETIAALLKAYASSHWVKDAQALELEIRTQMGQAVNPGAESDEDLKIYAINSLMSSDPAQALPILQRLLNSNNSTRIKEKALFVLSQSPSPEARKLLSDIARGSTKPELQHKAIDYLGMMGNDESRKELVAIYQTTSDKGLKSEILKGLMISGARGFLLTVAKSEKDPELRNDAIRQLAMTGAQDELREIYQSSNSIDEKEGILSNFFMTGNSARLAEVAASNADPRLRMAAIKSLGLMGGGGRADLLVQIYRSDKNRDLREAVLNSLFIQQNGKALVDLARAETDPEMKREIVKKMALVQSKETQDYMMELLK